MGTLREELLAAAPVAHSGEIDKILAIVHAHIPGDAGPATVLDEANELIHGERLKHYGHPKVNFQRIATGWSQYLGNILQPGRAIEASDVCIMMIILKAMRMTEGYHKDSIVDIAGYTALAAILAGDDEL